MQKKEEIFYLKRIFKQACQEIGISFNYFLQAKQRCETELCSLRPVFYHLITENNQLYIINFKKVKQNAKN
jgi:hypothetical protein